MIRNFAASVPLTGLFLHKLDGTLEFQLQLLALGVFLSKEFYLFLGDLLPSIFNCILPLVLCPLKVLSVSMFELL